MEGRWRWRALGPWRRPPPPAAVAPGAARTGGVRSLPTLCCRLAARLALLLFLFLGRLLAALAAGCRLGLVATAGARRLPVLVCGGQEPRQQGG
jgi:hypothetical protein